MDKYAELSEYINSQHWLEFWLINTTTGNFIVNNYKQALQLQLKLSFDLSKAKVTLNIKSNAIFHSWLAEEYDFLSSNSEPISAMEATAMDYVKVLKDLEKAT